MYRRINFIFIAAAVSLVSLLLLQAYWLRTSYNLADQQFKRDVGNVLEHLNYLMQYDEYKKDSLLKKQLDSSAEVPPNFDKTRFNGNSESSNQGQGTQQARQYIFETIKVIEIDTPHNKITGTSSSGSGPTGSYGNEVNNYLKRRFGLISRVTDSLLKLKSINIEYALKVSMLDSNRQEHAINSEKFHAFKNKYQPVWIGTKEAVLVQLSFDNSFYHIVYRIIWLLLTSLVIVIIIACAFVFMIKKIYSQKKIADIKNDFINNMTHEFKTPITTVSLGIEALKNFNEFSTSGRAVEYLEICSHEMDRVAGMIDKVLKISAFERSEITMIKRSFNIVALLNQVISNMQIQVKSKDIKLIFESSEDIIWVNGDEEHFKNVIYNLLDNAIKYSGKDPLIEISCNRIGGIVQLKFRDNGIGIPESYHRKIFEKFYRVPGNDFSIKGFGLGLSYVANIIRLHDAVIKLDSQPGRGSTFTIELNS